MRTTGLKHYQKLAEPAAPTLNTLDLAALPVHFVALLPRGRVFMHPDTPTSGVRDPWPPTFTMLPIEIEPAQPPRPAQDAVREAAERADKAMRDVFGGVDQFGDYCGHPVIPAKLAHAVQDLLAALAALGQKEDNRG